MQIREIVKRMESWFHSSEPKIQDRSKQWARFGLGWVIAPRTNKDEMIGNVALPAISHQESLIFPVEHEYLEFSKIHCNKEGKEELVIPTMSSKLKLTDKNHIWGDADLEQILKHLVENTRYSFNQRKALVDRTICDYVDYMDAALAQKKIVIKCSDAFKGMLTTDERFKNRPSAKAIASLHYKFEQWNRFDLGWLLNSKEDFEADKELADQVKPLVENPSSSLLNRKILVGFIIEDFLLRKNFFPNANCSQDFIDKLANKTFRQRRAAGE